MNKIILLLVVVVALISCNKKKQSASKDKKVVLYRDSTNVVKVSDTLVIGESTCRGCAYEESTHFGISDSMGIIKLENVLTRDNNSAQVEGGSVSKTLILVPQKTGKTIIKLYKFWDEGETAEDSLNFTQYTIDVQN